MKKKLLNELNRSREIMGGIKKYYKFNEGGYLEPGNKHDWYYKLTDEEYEKLREVNDKMKEMYEQQREHFRLMKLHNKGVIQHAVTKYGFDGK